MDTLVVVRLFSIICLVALCGLRHSDAERVLAVGDGHHRQSCKDGWVNIHRGCYKFLGTSRGTRNSWPKANETCRDMDGYLTVLQSKNEKEALEIYMAKNFPPRNKWWVNLVKEDIEWKWGDNSPVRETLLPWKSTSIRDRANYLCGAVYVDKKHRDSLMLTNDRCRKAQGFICEYHEINARSSTLSVIETHTLGSTSEQGESTQPSPTGRKIELVSQSSPRKTSPSTPFTFPSKSKKTSGQVASVSTEKTNIQESTTRVRRFTTGVSTSPLITSSADDSGPDNEIETETETETDLQEQTTHHVLTLTPFTAGAKGPITRLTSWAFNPSMMTTDANDDENDDNGDGGMTIEEIIHGTAKDRNNARERFNEKGYRRPSPRPNRPKPNNNPRKKTFAPQSFEFWVKAMEKYEGCYIPGMRGTVRQMVMNARHLYTDDADHCPQITASRLTFPRTEAGETAVVQCRRGTGYATLHCGDDTVCWEDQPDLSGCASPKFKALLKKIKEEQIETIFEPDSEEEEAEVEEQTFNMTSQLVAMTEDDDISVEDILVTSEVLTAFTHSSEDRKVKVKDKKAVKRIVGNVIRAGNNLLSKKKKKLWRKMRSGDKIRSASSLMVAMETTTLSMADNIEEPAVIKQVEENIEVEIQVVDVEKMEEEDEDEIVYDSEQSENTFSIPLENLKGSSHGGKLDKVVFITHYSMAEFLDGGDDDDDDDNEDGDDADVSDDSNKDESGGSLDNQNTLTESKYTPDEKGTAKVEENVEEEEEEEEEEPVPQIASYILSASIGGGEGHKMKLQKPVTFTMKHTVEVHKEDIRLCSFWDVSQGGSQGYWSQEGCEVKKSNRSHTKCECDHMTSFAILIDVHGFETPDVHKAVLRLITIIGCVISCLCLLISWITFQFCTALQGERNTIHKNLTACLFVSELLFVAGVTHTEPKITCSLVAVFLHFFFLCAFIWMFLEGIHIIFMLVQVFDASRPRLPYYYLIGYGVPVIVVGVSCIVYFPGYGTQEFCWLTTDRYFIWAFAGPVALILLVNAIFLTYAMTTVCRHSDYVFNAKDRGAGSPIRSWIQGALALEVLLGLTWIFGYFLLNENTLALAYIFTILNSLQGVFIFIFHCGLNKKAQKEYSRILRVPLGMTSMFASSHSTNGKRTNGSTKTHEMTHSTSNGRKTSLHYKPSIASQHNNYFNDKHNGIHHNDNNLHKKDDTNDVISNNNGDDLQSSKDLDDKIGNAYITIDSGGQAV